MENGIVKREESTPATLDIGQVATQVKLVQQMYEEIMKENEHYGKIPGCGDKPTLLKAGAEKLTFACRLAPTYEVERVDYNGSHREYIVTTTLTSIITGKVVGQGVGSCSTLENKYRFRTGPKEFTGNPVPKKYWDTRDSDPKGALKLLGGPGFGTGKNPDTGKWEITKQGEKVEHDNPADYYNTVLKMAKKRSLVDVTLTATAASDIFTQDIEDMKEIISREMPVGQAEPEKPKDAPKQEQPKKTSNRRKRTQKPKEPEQPIEPEIVDPEPSSSENEAENRKDHPSDRKMVDLRHIKEYGEPLTSEQKTKILKAYGQYGVEQENLEAVLGLTITMWDEGSRQALLDKYNEIINGEIDAAQMLVNKEDVGMA